MAHTHEYDCIVCGAHFDSQNELAAHDREVHEPKHLPPSDAPAEPMGTEKPRDDR